MNLHVVLVEPEIPQNTGNIARTCAAAGCSLHLVKPLGFSLSEKSLKRAGLDYWDQVDVTVHNSFSDFIQLPNPGELILASTKSRRVYTEMEYPEECYLLFGKETSGLPEYLLAKYEKQCIRIPMIKGARSLNLSNAAAVIVYEVLRKNNFSSLQIPGNWIPQRGQTL